ncbi:MULTISPECIES: 1-acyl-sn-glycerol-3-phosphate acyltransferase [Flavobacterium]|jgi:1-acyl-sn-glycerol-3-phosphate acyltransferase|uniref:1-acyl-sn-glycerol-3-phosphate acyltransferase n=1 Tax=Flavobacterium lindanitolerans TaxID=428988 RepID=A0A497UYH9_9FLAO|nr:MULTISPECIES: 1-acyl-sn-glycerol-3-phosphate acyltransferase [Flavobacterium]PZQ92472.1 MAG: glycerol acyltransferase [Flavobacterium johnsoniae]MBL7868351.1 1-acyl-sn-glycerol-3-phosphate acyltransferase [Flavobacterium lindanitolerans]OJX51086.1 MAG: glycerol acyltransferase [Flavobacterium sp. 38-13]PKW28653.1 1-acyl-sn-glycerol-3-phosphate acyltransferase [Flavobacterium lindanitolerans]RLJ35842.1 1-acyl-sn-glycerol-3-phosphate acyltransferase [Flavobacterium lindanitolerans]
MSKFDKIRPFYDSEVNEALCKVADHPMMKAMMSFTYPDVEEKDWIEQLKRTHSIRDFQCNFIYHAVMKVLEKSSDGLTTSGFEKLEKHTPYLFISNHRDIILDTSLLNTCLFDHGLVMTASAIGDNLVRKSFLHTLSKLNRNFLVQRSLSPRELLQSSKLMSEYICQLILRENRSVWIAQREGRTKDGNDATHPGVLKMLSMGSDEENLMDYFKKLKIVPVSISYEYDPTDALKMPQLMAEANDEVYIKEKNEDFMTLLSGIMGQKKRIHIHVGDVLESELDEIASKFDNSNRQIQALAQAIDDSVLANYKLWPTNYIAYDLLNNTDKYSHLYTEKEKSLFERRLEIRIDENNPLELQGFLAMYANPVVNKSKYENAV